MEMGQRGLEIPLPEKAPGWERLGPVPCQFSWVVLSSGLEQLWVWGLTEVQLP
jgi:hypothetical protein